MAGTAGHGRRSGQLELTYRVGVEADGHLVLRAREGLVCCGEQRANVLPDRKSNGKQRAEKRYCRPHLWLSRAGNRNALATSTAWPNRPGNTRFTPHSTLIAVACNLLANLRSSSQSASTPWLVTTVPHPDTIGDPAHAQGLAPGPRQHATGAGPRPPLAGEALPRHVGVAAALPGAAQAQGAGSAGPRPRAGPAGAPLREGGTALRGAGRPITSLQRQGMYTGLHA